MRWICDGNYHQIVTESIASLTRYSSFAGGCQNDEFSPNGSSKILNDLRKPPCDGEHHPHNITINQLILKQHVTPRNDKKPPTLFRITQIELCHTKTKWSIHVRFKDLPNQWRHERNWQLQTTCNTNEQHTEIYMYRLKMNEIIYAIHTKAIQT